MSNNDDTNANEYINNILAQYLQQQASGGNGGAQGNISSNVPGLVHVQPPGPSVQAQPPPERGQQNNQDALNALLASYLKASSSTAGTAAPALPQEQYAYANQINALQPAQQSQTGHGDLGGSGNALGQQILSSVQRLAAINPTLVSAAITRALALHAPPTAHGQAPHDVNQQGLGNLQPQVSNIICHSTCPNRLFTVFDSYHR